ncbi:MAG: hypothetical protein J6Q50_05320 [Clostridia bacterium]|nr:hypothetical protein [Clostridia bacterium]
MFCVLNVEKKNRNFFEKIFKFLARDEYSIATVPVFKGAPFYMLNASVYDAVDWERVIEHSGKCCKRLVVNGNIIIPENQGVGVFNSPILYNKVFMNTLLHIIKNNVTIKTPQNITVYDKKGVYADFLTMIVPYASQITVVTDNKDKYTKVCDKILENTGLCVSLLSDFNDGTIKINIDKNVMSICTKNQFINVTCGENMIVNNIYKKLLPKGVDEYTFYSALYELCGVFSLGECIFETVTVNNEKKHIDTVTFS